MAKATASQRDGVGEAGGKDPRPRLADALRRFDAQFPLGVKLALPLLVTACVGSFIVMKVVYDDEAARIRSDFEARASLIAQDVRGAIAAEDSAYAPSNPNSGLQRHIDYLLEAEPSILRIDVLSVGPDARIVASTDHARIGTSPDDAPHELAVLAGSHEVWAGEEDVDGQRALESVVPFPTKVHGPMATAVYLSTAQRDAHLAALLRSFFVGAGLTGTGALALLTVCLHVLVIRRVRRVLRATARLEAGDFTVRIAEAPEHRARDEMVELARHFNRTVASISDLHARLAEAATTDQLTGLANRHHLMETLSREIAQSHRMGRPLAVVMADLDGLKQVNDGLGHSAGDAALRDAADAVRAALRAGDLGARIGGDEFVAVLPGCGAEELRGVLRRLQAAAGAGATVAEGPTATLSAGGAVLRADDDAESLLQRADRAMYEAKRAGKNQTRIAA